MMTMDTWSCTFCNTTQPAGPSPYHWDRFVMTHLPCDDLAAEQAAADRDRLSAHAEKIGDSQGVWFLRTILGATTLWLMLGMYLLGAHPWQWAGVGCAFFVALLFLFEDTPDQPAQP